MKSIFQELFLGVLVIVMITTGLFTLITSTETWATLLQTMTPLALVGLLVFHIISRFGNTGGR